MFAINKNNNLSTNLINRPRHDVNISPVVLIMNVKLIWCQQGNDIVSLAAICVATNG